MLEAPVRWPRPSRLEGPLDVPAGQAGRRLGALGLTSVGALLEHLPRDSREARTVAALKGGGAGDGRGAGARIGARRGEQSEG